MVIKNFYNIGSGAKHFLELKTTLVSSSSDCIGAKTLSITAISITTYRIVTFSTKGLFATLTIDNIHHNITVLSAFMLSVVFIHCYAESYYDECRYADFQYAECSYAEYPFN
jgi:hypothetical protein